MNKLCALSLVLVSLTGAHTTWAQKKFTTIQVGIPPQQGAQVVSDR